MKEIKSLQQNKMKGLRQNKYYRVPHTLCFENLKKNDKKVENIQEILTGKEINENE